MCCFRPVRCLTKILISLLVLIMLVVGIFLALILLTPRSLGIADKAIFGDTTIEEIGMADLSIWDSIKLYRSLTSPTIAYDAPTQADKDKLKQKLEETSVDFENVSEIFNNELLTKSGSIAFSEADLTIIFYSIANENNILSDINVAGVNAKVVDADLVKIDDRNAVRLLLALNISDDSIELSNLSFINRVLSETVWIRLSYFIDSTDGIANTSFSSLSINDLKNKQTVIVLNALFAAGGFDSDETPEEAISNAGQGLLNRVLCNIGRIDGVANGNISFTTGIL